MSYSLDVNILLYASDDTSPRHVAAKDFLEGCASRMEPFCVAWITIMAYLRMATHPGIFTRPLTPQRALDNVNGLVRLPQVRLLSEQEGFLQIYAAVTEELVVRGNLVPDAHLVALLKQHGVSVLYSGDRDLRKFDCIEVRDPFVAA